MAILDLAGVSRAVATALEGPCAVPRGTPLAVACSGGADSVALVHAVAALGPEFPLVAVLFVDHGLRDVAAERLAAERAAVATGAAFRLARLPPLGPGNLQAAARAARYRALLALAPAGALVATGHTADDQTETLLGRLTRGTGIPGLRGIRPRDGRIIRPLLTVPRVATRGLGLPFADDPSNDTPRFLRNRLRAAVVPPLLAENPRLHEAFAALVAAAEGTVALLDALLPEVCPEGPSEPISLPLTGLSPHALAALLRHLAGRLAPDTPPSHAALEAVAAALATAPERPAGGSLGNGWSLRWDPARGHLTFEPERDPRVARTLDGLGVFVVHGFVLRLGLAASEADPALPPDARWPLVAALEAGGLVLRDAADREVWSEAGGVPTCSGRDAVPVAAGGGPFALRVAPARPLTVVARGFLRVLSADSTPPTRSGRSS